MANQKKRIKRAKTAMKEATKEFQETLETK